MKTEQLYWNKFYTTYKNLQCSQFCEFVLDYLAGRDHKYVLDAGCGNGRDSYALGDSYLVTGVDTSKHVPTWTDRVQFYTDDFCTHRKADYDLIYSRFTFHAITNAQHSVFLKSITEPGTTLCIECRSDKDKDCERYHGDTHYRNFVNLDYLRDKVRFYGFKIDYLNEAKGFAPYETEDPYCIRLVATKL